MIVGFVAITLLIRSRSSEDRNFDKTEGGALLYKKSWASMYIDGIAIKQMMTIQFWEKYLVIYHTYSAKTVLRVKYDDISKSDSHGKVFHKHEYKFQLDDQARVMMFFRSESEILDSIIDKNESNQRVHSIAGSARSE